VDGLDTTSLYALAPHSGNIAAAFYSNSNTVTDQGVATLSQVLATAASQKYDLSFYVANPVQDGMDFNNVFSVSWNGVLVALSSPFLTETAPGAKTYVVAPNSSWFQVTATGLMAIGGDSLEFAARNSDWGTLLDDVVVVPEVSSFGALVGGGLLVLGSTVRLRRRALAPA
jgi:hypothetical protein